MAKTRGFGHNMGLWPDMIHDPSLPKTGDAAPFVVT